MRKAGLPHYSPVDVTEKLIRTPLKQTETHKARY
jgi:hypothetical protein